MAATRPWKTAAAREAANRAAAARGADTRAAGTRAATWSLVQLLNIPLLLFVQLNLLVQLASKGKRAAACEAASRAAYLVARATASREAADHTAATVLFVLIMPLLLFCSCSSLRKTAATPAACFKRIHMSL
jgi:hypothetical protein